MWLEWVIANGLGGFAMGTALGVNTRRYHGLLVAATRPPVGRAVVLSQVADVLRLRVGEEEQVVHLTPFHFSGHPRAEDHPWLESVEHDGGMHWTYRVEANLGGLVGVVRVVKSLELADGHNGCSLRYDVDVSGEAAGAMSWAMELSPMVVLRDAHELRAAAAAAELTHRVLATPEGQPGVLVATAELGVHVSCDAGRFEPAPKWWEGIDYLWETKRGQDHTEQIFTPGQFVASGTGAGSLTLSASVAGDQPGPAAAHPRRTRVAGLVEHVLAQCPGAAGADRDRLARLAAASDLFVVKRRGEAVDGVGEDAGVSVIAGYPWFTDWGRDTMISLPGLLLCTGRHDEAGRTLATFAKHRRRGLIPNNFADQNTAAKQAMDPDERIGGASYNTVDASLWFVQACGAYVEATGDHAFFARELEPACAEIIQCYTKGTDYGIGTDPADGLVVAGDAKTQLTWMDARRDGVTFTPRHGKAVEINALWHHALVTLARLTGDADHAVQLRTQAARVRASFAAVFVEGPGGGLWDRAEPKGSIWIKPMDVRPNQVFAASLADGPMDQAGRAAVVGVVQQELWTDAGLRTLGAQNPGYRGRFEGDLFSRDGAYHNGTVWPWLIGAFAEGVLRAGGFSESSREAARAAVRPVIDRLGADAIGSIPEVYDGDEPRRPDGCMAQAWSVAEPLRALMLTYAE